MQSVYLILAVAVANLGIGYLAGCCCCIAYTRRANWTASLPDHPGAAALAADTVPAAVPQQRTTEPAGAPVTPSPLLPTPPVAEPDPQPTAEKHESAPRQAKAATAVQQLVPPPDEPESSAVKVLERLTGRAATKMGHIIDAILAPGGLQDRPLLNRLAADLLALCDEYTADLSKLVDDVENSSSAVTDKVIARARLSTPMLEQLAQLETTTNNLRQLKADGEHDAVQKCVAAEIDRLAAALRKLQASTKAVADARL
jgi:hypothetical protein